MFEKCKASLDSAHSLVVHSSFFKLGERKKKLLSKCDGKQTSSKVPRSTLFQAVEGEKKKIIESIIQRWSNNSTVILFASCLAPIHDWRCFPFAGCQCWPNGMEHLAKHKSWAQSVKYNLYASRRGRRFAQLTINIFLPKEQNVSHPSLPLLQGNNTMQCALIIAWKHMYWFFVFCFPFIGGSRELNQP